MTVNKDLLHVAKIIHNNIFLLEQRNIFTDEINEVIKEHDNIKKLFDERKKSGEIYEHLKLIYNWEKESILKIKKRSKELQSQLIQFTEIHNQNFKEKSQNLSEDIIKSRELSHFIEIDLYHWKKTIEELKLNFLSPITINLEQHENSILIENIMINIVKKVTNELFEQIYDDKAWTEQDGQLVLHDNSNHPTEIRGKNEYNTGCHHIRLSIEETLGHWMFIGINSRLIPLQNQSYSSLSSYGWSSDNYNWSAGEQFDNNCIEMINNDIINLFIDCDNRIISMINQRTRIKHILPVVIDDCPFPWQLHVVLQEPNSRLRILST